MTLFKISLISPLFIAIGVQAADLAVNITNVHSDKGTISVALCADQTCHENIDRSSNPHKPTTQIVTAVKGVTQVVFSHLNEGEYSIWIFHDLNGNGVADRNIFGYPQEPFGVSNLSKFPTSKPGWEKSKFKFAEPGLTYEMKLIDP